jgi:hypothetical protein
MSRKPRSDSKLDALSEEQHVTLAEWLTIENVSYTEAKSRVLDQFGVSTSVAALQSFFSRFAAPWKYARAADEADQFAALMEGKFDAASIKRAKQLAFEAMSGPRPDLKAARALLKIVGDSAKLSLAQEKLSLDARKVKLLEAKAALADQAKVVASDDGLSETEQLARFKQIFGAS